MPKATQFVRELSLLDSILLLAGGIIGSGIFLSIRQVALNTRSPALFLSIWIVGMAISMLACFAFAEMGAMFPEAGGQYVYLREAYGELVAFLYGWMIFTVSVCGTIAALGAGFADYLGSIVPALSAEHRIFVFHQLVITRAHAVAVLAIAIQTLINVLGVHRGAVLQNLATWMKFAAIGIFVVLGVAVGRGSWSHYAVSLPAASSSIWSGIGVALIAVFWAYDGWVYITWVAGEVKDPQRNLPRSLIGGLLLVGLLYTAINAVYLYALPLSDIAAQNTVAKAAGVAMFSAGAGGWLALMIAISCFGAMASCIMSGARVYYAMAEDGVFFRSLARVSPRWHTPVASLVLQGVWSAALVLSGSYDQLFTYVMFMMVVSYVLTVGALFILRRKMPERERPYRCIGYPWLPALYMVLCSLWAVNALWEKPKEAFAGIAIVLAAIPFYFYWRGQKKVSESGIENSVAASAEDPKVPEG